MKQTKVSVGKEMSSIRWDEIHRRMEAVATALEGQLSPKQKRRILAARAKALAHESEKRETPREPLEVVEFLLAEERYGIETNYIREVYPLRELAAVPCTPAFVLGVTNVRGRVVSVLDIGKFLDLPQKSLTELDKIIVVQNGRMELGIRADAILGIRSIPLDELQPSPPTLAGIRERYLKGLTKELVAILDIERLLSDKRIIVHDQLSIQVST